MKRDNLLAFENQTTFYDQFTQLLQTGARKLIFGCCGGRLAAVSGLVLKSLTKDSV